jgi:hypothetical protein
MLADTWSAGVMGRCIVALQPAAVRTAGSLWRRAHIPWRRFISGLSDPYRPERHYMRGPGPKCRERQGRGYEAQSVTVPTADMINKQTAQNQGMPHKYCPKCTTLMVLERVVPKFGPLPELRTYKCLRCGCVIDEDIGRGN